MTRTRKPRAVNRTAAFARAVREYTERLRDQGHRFGYAVPMFRKQRPLGCIFFQSYRKDCFQPEVVRILTIFAQLIARMVALDPDCVEVLNRRREEGDQSRSRFGHDDLGQPRGRERVEPVRP